MKVLALHPNFKMPTKSTDGAGAFDIYMPEAGIAHAVHTVKVHLGFATEIPEGHVALILPRSGVGSNKGLELNNTCGVIDSDYRGEWIAAIKVKNLPGFSWEAGERILQFLVVPVADVVLERVHALPPTRRNTGGFGSTGA